MTQRTKQDFIRKMRFMDRGEIVNTVEEIANKVSIKHDGYIDVVMNMTGFGSVEVHVECEYPFTRHETQRYIDMCVFGEDDNIQEVLDSI